MNIFENLKFDKWYAIVLYTGILLIASSLFFKIDFLNSKHLFGCGIGFFLIGISFWIAEKTISIFKEANIRTGGPGILHTKIIKHSFTSIVILAGGIGLSLYFGWLIIKSLI